VVFGFVIGGKAEIERQHRLSGDEHRAGVYAFQVAGLGGGFADDELYNGVVLKRSYGSLYEACGFF
jgi:hypothetical protein